MVPEVGHFASILALVDGDHAGHGADDRRGARNSVLDGGRHTAPLERSSSFSSLPSAALAYSFVTNDFTVLNVASQFTLAVAGCPIALPPHGARTKARCCCGR